MHIAMSSIAYLLVAAMLSVPNIVRAKAEKSGCLCNCSGFCCFNDCRASSLWRGGLWRGGGVWCYVTHSRERYVESATCIKKLSTGAFSAARCNIDQQSEIDRIGVVI